MITASTNRQDIQRGDRFEFGRNWASFLKTLTDHKIKVAEHSLVTMLELPNLREKSFLDIGSGSGLFSLAAYRLGAHVHSFDFDPDSVACTAHLRERYCDDHTRWTVEEGSVLDTSYLNTLGTFDIVYSWGVLHHTGSLWQALANVAPLVRERGKLFIAVYNDQGEQSQRWRQIKKVYGKVPRAFRPIYSTFILGLSELRFLAGDLVKLRPAYYISRWTQYSKTSLRGMNKWHDHIDWVGGYPFEVAKPEEVLSFFRKRGFQLTELHTCGGGHGCNEYVFEFAFK